MPVCGSCAGMCEHRSKCNVRNCAFIVTTASPDRTAAPITVLTSTGLRYVSCLTLVERAKHRHTLSTLPVDGDPIC